MDDTKPTGPADFEPRYNPQEIEEKIYKQWEDAGYFNPDICIEKGITAPDAEPFSIVLPPPNVTGTLHVGHALEDTLQDIVVRVNRMSGKRTLWVPGTDHAASATPVRVEKDIYKKEGKTRHDLGREEFLRRVNEFAQTSHDTIVHQVRRMGASLDWSREAYTLDEARSLGVRTAFKKMYDMGLIYRGNRIVHWDPKGQTTISDDEIEWVEETVPFYYLKYGPFTIGTARPETKFGDKYVVMHPDDPRYAQYKDGQKIDLEWINGPITATVIKDPASEMDFGTGVMTITPWHDMVDFDIAERHKLDMEQIIDQRGVLLPIAGEFAGMHIKKARAAIVEKLQAKGLVEKIDEKYIHRIATNSRGGGVIEPQVMRQWFVNVNAEFTLPHSDITGIASGQKTTLKEIMRTVVRNGQIKILPERFEKIYFHWIDNLRDWCISRQIWFGHRIPVWYCMTCNEPQIDIPAKAKWLLVRHGESKFNREKRSQGQMEGNPLTEEGVAQAGATAAKLKNRAIDFIVSSDLERCKMTAEIIAEATGAKIVFDKRLRERGLGDAEGMTREERDAKYGEALWHYASRISGGEAPEDLNKRLMEFLSEIAEKHKDKNVVVVTHGAPINFLLGKIKKINPETIDNQKIISNAEIAELTVGQACPKCGNDFYEQDPDTLDTWFSSGLWPFSTLGWPNETDDLKTYFPNSFMNPGYEILFFWVARMILMSGCLLGKIPFKTVYLHGMVRDAKGQKFSKSLGNGIDPLVLANTYGADAIRMALVLGAVPGNDVSFDEQRVKGYRNFSTKIWNIGRFIRMNEATSETAPTMSEAHQKYMEEFAGLKSEIDKHLGDFEFHLAGEKIYHYVWHRLADEIIEAEKETLKSGTDEEKAASYAVLVELFLGSLKLLHPFMPFVTEAVWQKFRPGTVLMVEKG